MQIPRLLVVALICLLPMHAADHPIPPQFPRVKGDLQMTAEWKVTLPTEFARRIEEGSLVLWKKGVTCWTVIYDLKKDETPQTRLQFLKRDLPKDIIEQWEDAEAMPLRYAYLILEKNEGERWALYSFIVGQKSHVMMAIYFDRKEDLSEARLITASIAQTSESK